MSFKYFFSSAGVLLEFILSFNYIFEEIEKQLFATTAPHLPLGESLIPGHCCGIPCGEEGQFVYVASLDYSGILR